MALRRAKWTHEVNTKMSLREDFERSILLQAKDFAFAREAAAEAWKTGGYTMGKDVFANGPMFSRSDPNLNIFIFVCSSAFKFGTVWRQHNKYCIWQWGEGHKPPPPLLALKNNCIYQRMENVTLTSDYKKKTRLYSHIQSYIHISSILFTVAVESI